MKSPTKLEMLKRKRIHKSVFGKDIKIYGYPGLKYTALLISEYIPNVKIYVEPFAGLGRLTRYITSEQKILNDKSEFAYKYLLKHQPNNIILKMDWLDVIKKYDSSHTFFLLDPPWSDKIYDNNDKPFKNLKAIEYYQQFFKIAPVLEAHWIILSDRTEHDIKKICSKSKYNNKLLISKKKIFNGTASVLLTSNQPFIRYHQTQLP